MTLDTRPIADIVNSLPNADNSEAERSRRGPTVLCTWSDIPVPKGTQMHFRVGRFVVVGNTFDERRNIYRVDLKPVPLPSTWQRLGLGAESEWPDHPSNRSWYTEEER
jgi:hypothetical protein